MGAGEVSTVWTQVRRAVDGSQEDRDAFGRRYLPLVREYLRRRWEGWWLAGSVDDAAQDVFVECFRPGGVLTRAEPGRGLRGLLVATARNVARRHEESAAQRRERTPHETAFLHAQPAREDSLTALFDRRWAEATMAEAAGRMEQLARQADDAARQRFELLQLRFEEGLPIRDIAARWGLDPRQVHDAYARARREFHRCLREVVAAHGGVAHSDLDRECQELLDLLG
jgi:RNA polymerase sigma factor (sigma-70 family)